MPPPPPRGEGLWPQSRIELFGRWIEDRCLPGSRANCVVGQILLASGSLTMGKYGCRLKGQRALSAVGNKPRILIYIYANA